MLAPKRSVCGPPALLRYLKHKDPRGFPAHVYDPVRASALALWDALLEVLTRLPPVWEFKLFFGGAGDWDLVVKVVRGPQDYTGCTGLGFWGPENKWGVN